MTILLNNVDTNQNSEAFVSTGGPAVVRVTASDFGGATVEIQYAAGEDALNRFGTLTSGTFTADGTIKIDYLPPGEKIRAALSGITAPTDGVFVSIVQ